MSARGATRQAVLDYLIAQADLDGLVIVSGREIGDALDVHQTAINQHIHNLAADGFLTIARGETCSALVDGWGSGGGPGSAIQLSESVLA